MNLRPLCRLALLASVPALASLACSSAPTEQRVGTTGSPIASSDAVSRAMQWVDAKLHYCESAYGQPDYDSACSSVCWRTENKAWDAYRSDCSGFVTWAWGLPPVGDGGYVTGEFAPYSSSFSHTIEGSQLAPGDALNRNSGGHIVLFKQWETPGSSAIFMEEPGCSSSTPYAHEFSSSVSISGSNVYISYEGETFTAIRFDGITEGPPAPPPPPAKVCGHAQPLDPPLKACSGGAGAPAVPPAPTATGALAAGEGLAPGGEVSSADGRFHVVMQTDGNAVLYSGSAPLWATGTKGKAGQVFVMQTDGNLVLYSDTGCALWASNTSGHPGATLAVQNDGNVVVYDAGKALWASGTGGVLAAPTGCGAIGVGQGLAAGEAVTSCDGRFQLTLQEDGNTVLYAGGMALWGTGTDCQYGRSLAMQSDGNLVVYSNTGEPLWASHTNGHPGATLAVQNDGNVVLYDAGKPLWASNTVVPGAPGKTSGCGRIDPGQGLEVGQSYESCDGRFSLDMQSDGNLVLYMGSKALWATGTNGKAGFVANMQTDGNFVLYTTREAAAWSSHTYGHAGAYLAVQNDGNLVVYEGSTPLWSSGTYGH